MTVIDSVKRQSTGGTLRRHVTTAKASERAAITGGCACSVIKLAKVAVVLKTNKLLKRVAANIGSAMWSMLKLFAMAVVLLHTVACIFHKLAGVSLYRTLPRPRWLTQHLPADERS